MRRILFLVVLFSAIYTSAQSVNDYKYVIVDNQYEFQKEANEYRLNELMVFLLEKYGFEAYRNNEVLPADINVGLCNALQLKVEKSGTLWSDIVAKLKNCNGDVVFETQTARGKEKNYQKAYFAATRNAFESFKNLNYKYNGGKSYTAPVEVVEDVQEEIPNAKDVEVTEVIEVSQEEKVWEETEDSPVDLPNYSGVSEAEVSMDFTDNTSTEYALKFDETKNNFELFQHSVPVGSGRKSAAGVYLVSSGAFTGIGFLQDSQFIIEYDENGATKRIVLEK